MSEASAESLSVGTDQTDQMHGDAPIVGSSEMAAAVRAFDWEKTPLGRLSNWSPALISFVNLLVCSPLPATLSWGTDLIFLYNDATIPTLGTKHPGALGRRYKNVFEEAWPLVGPDMESCLRSGEAPVREDVMIPLLRDGKLIEKYWTYSLVPVYDDGQIVAVYNPYQETTQGVVALQEREAAAGQLEQVLEDTSDAIMTIDREWRVTYMNSRALQVSAPINPIGQNIWKSYPSFVYEGSPWTEHYYRAMDERIAGSFEAFYSDPINVWVLVQVQPSPEGITLFFRDVTKDKQSAAALIQNEKLAAVGRLASSIAHEINNPLEAVTNLLYIARGSRDVEEIHQALDLADQEVRRMTVITNQTLRFHRQSTLPQDITCLDLFSTVLVMYESKIKNLGIQVEKRKRANKPVRIFEGDIRQVLNNLIGNAIDAMKAGGRLLVRSREATRWSTGQKGLILTVADTGSGMPHEVASRIFEAFYTTKGIGGSGLGLWISKEIVDRHHGSLRVRSSEAPGRHGSVFTLFLPFDEIPL